MENIRKINNDLINNLLNDIDSFNNNPILDINVNDRQEYINGIDLFTIINYSQVCLTLNIKELTELDFSFLDKQEAIKQLNYHKIQNITKLFNKNWIPNWLNSKEEKYYPYFIKNSSGWSFIDSCFDRGFSYGEPGFFKNKDISDYCGKTFIDIYNHYLS